MANKTKSGYEVLFSKLGEAGVKRIFGIPGREAQVYKFDEMPLMDFVSLRNESAAVICSGVYNFILDGIKSVSWTTFGPGFANSIEGIYTCHMDGYPTLAISAQIETNMLNPETHQYINQEKIAKEITNFSYEIKDVKEIPFVVNNALINSKTPKYDVSFLSIPLDLKIDIQYLDEVNLTDTECSSDREEINFNEIDNITNKILTSKFPLLIVGRECGKYQTLVRKFINKFKLPTVTTYQGKGIVEPNNLFHIGTISHYFDSITRSDFINNLLSKSDCIILIGYNMNELAYDYRLATFQPGKSQKVIIINSSKIKVPKEINIDNEIIAPIGIILENIIKIDTKYPDSLLEKRKEILKQIKDIYSENLNKIKDDSMFKLVFGIRKVIGNDGIMITDTGIHKQYVALFDETPDFKKNLCSNGASTMGFGLPAVLGAAFALKDSNEKKPLVLIVGDGGFHAMNQDLELIKRFALPITAIVVLKDNSFGLIKNYELRGFGEYNRLSIGFGEVDFVKLAESQGLKARNIRIKDVPNLIKKIINTKSEPMVLEVHTDYSNFFSYNANIKWKEYKGSFD